MPPVLGGGAPEDAGDVPPPGDAETSMHGGPPFPGAVPSRLPEELNALFDRMDAADTKEERRRLAEEGVERFPDEIEARYALYEHLLEEGPREQAGHVAREAAKHGHAAFWELLASDFAHLLTDDEKEQLRRDMDVGTLSSAHGVRLLLAIDDEDGALAAFETVLGGDGYTDHYWALNTTLERFAKSRRSGVRFFDAYREWLRVYADAQGLAAEGAARPWASA